MLEKFKLIENSAAVISLEQLLTVYISVHSLIIYRLCVSSLSIASSCRQSHLPQSLIVALGFSALLQGGSVSLFLQSDKEVVKVKIHISPQNICAASQQNSVAAFKTTKVDGI